MAQSNQALKVALAAVEQLPLSLQRKLAEQVLVSIAGREGTLIVRFQRLPAVKQARMAELMDKNDDGNITRSELLELKQLNEEVSRIVLANSKTLAQILRPELFDERGQPIKSRNKAASKSSAKKRNVANREPRSS